MKDVFLSTELPSTEQILRRPEEPGETLPGSPDLRDITNPAIGGWRQFRATLKPKYWRAWAEISFCLAMLLGGYAAHFGLARSLGNLVGMIAAPFFAVWLGFWLNAILTFGHEAAHYNLSASKSRNDFLADWSIWLFFPQSSKSYRKSHWQHHLYLGDPQDTEISYHNCMSPWFLARAITGLYLVELMARYALGRGAKPKLKASQSKPNRAGQLGQILAVVRSGTTHAVLIGVPLYFHCYSTCVTWVAGAALVFPFLATVRQLLEHRAEDAHCDTNYREVAHGPVNRMFSKNLFSRFYGAAGFNRHLLHHWDPTVSYTCFDEMERFFAGTRLQPQIERSQTTYTSNLILLARKALRDLAT
jgi:fatty acid desaturase